LEERTRDEARQAAEAEATKARAVTFKEAAIAFIDAKRAGWSNPKHAAQWAATLEAHAYSVIGAAPVSEIDRERVLSVLRPVWERIPETATRLRGRLENILDFATVNGWREGDNPARWRGNLKQILADRNKMAAVQPRPALPWRLMPQFWAEMDQTSPIAANVLRFQILTAARPSEARSLRWGELDMAGAVWTVPARRMKARVTHWVPLSTSALSILEAMTAHGSRADAYVFPGARDGKPLSDATVGLILERMNHPKLRWIDPKLEGRPVVPHGFRSTFRDWAGEATDTAREIIEMSLAHSVGNKAERAYSRSDQIDKRRALLDAWADFVTSGGATE
jgi:integrase